MTLTIISHTEHYINSEGEIVGWGPTVREINNLISLFDEIIHIGVLHSGEAPASGLPYKSNKIKFIPIQPFGGPRFKDKVKVILSAPKVTNIVIKAISRSDWWQFRAPTGIGVYLIPILCLFTQKPGWFKYAGNWGQNAAPLGYRLQRFFLIRQNRYKVTVNGQWPHQPKHLISFENPCLTDNERLIGQTILEQKSYNGHIEVCFVGRLESEKGIDRIIQALKNYPDPDRISHLHIVGDGPEASEFKKMALDLKIRVTFYGWMSRDHLSNVFSQCHLILLPSTASEGFPKVLAEAANYGCIPVVSDISSIPNYINSSNGYIWSVGSNSFSDFFSQIDLKGKTLTIKAKNAYDFAEKFTFEYYKLKLMTRVVNDQI